RLSAAATTDERARSGKLKAQEKTQHELELKRVIQSIKKLLAKIEDAVPLINLAITASGTSLSSTLPTTVSPSRLLQASTFLTAGDSQYSLNPSQSVQIGPTFFLSMYMLFSGHMRPQYEEDIRENTWKEVIHKANVKLMRVPIDSLYDLAGEKHDNVHLNGSTPASPNPSRQKENSQDFFLGVNEEQARADEYAYQLLIIEDLEDDRVHTLEDDQIQPGSFGDVALAGIREALPVHEVSKIFYADTGKILNIGTEGEVNSPILLLKRDINAIPPRRMAERHNDDIPPKFWGETPESRSSLDPKNHSQLIRTTVDQRSPSATSTPRKGTEVIPAANPWRIPQDLDPEWIAFEVYTESEDSDLESESDVPTKPSRTPSVEPNITTAMSRLQVKSPSATPSSPYPTSSQPQAGPQLPPIRTSLSLLETLLRLLSLQQFQQTPHLSIPDELLTFFLSESASTGTAGGDVEERKRLRDEARRTVGFDPYDESPIKRRGEEYQYRNHQDHWNGEQEYDGQQQPYTPESAYGNGGYGTPSPRYDYPSPASAPRSVKESPGPQNSPSWPKTQRSLRPGTPRGTTPPVRWKPGVLDARRGIREGSPLARPPTGFTDEGLGSSPKSRLESPPVEAGVNTKDGGGDEGKRADVGNDS
ncbi:MAG: hypothetical protein Q9183_005868, partial [Haloplaca sp. 2 TL-2023]